MSTRYQRWDAQFIGDLTKPLDHLSSHFFCSLLRATLMCQKFPHVSLSLTSNSNFGLGRVSGLPIAYDLAKVVIPLHPGGSDDQPLTLR